MIDELMEGTDREMKIRAEDRVRLCTMDLQDGRALMMTMTPANPV